MTKSEENLGWFSYTHESQSIRVEVSNGTTVFGRSGECDVSLPFRQMSRKHFQVSRDGGLWVIEDLRSSFGTFLNGQRISSRVLQKGDRVTVGPPGTLPLVLVFCGFEKDHPIELGTLVIDEGGATPTVNGLIEVAQVDEVREADTSRTGEPGEKGAARYRDLVQLFGEMGQVLLAGSSVNEMLQSVLDLTFRRIRAQRGAICLWNAGGDAMTVRAARSQGGDQAIHISRRILDEVVKQRRALLVNDLGGDERFQNSESMLGLNIHSVLCAPMYHKGDVLGLIYMDASGLPSEGGASFDMGDLELLVSIAIFAAAGVDRARMQEEIAEEQHRRAVAHRRIQVLLQVAKSLSSELNTDTLIGMIMTKARELVEAERCTLFLVDRLTGELWSKVADGTREIRIPMTKGIAGHVASTGQLVNIADAYEDERFNPDVDRKTGFRTRSILCLPLRNNEGRVVGVTQMINKQGGGLFLAEDEQLMEAFSAQAAVAIENAQLFQQTLQMRNHLESILASITNMVLTLDGKGRLATANRPVEPFFHLPETMMRAEPYSSWFADGNEGFVQDVTRVYEDPKPVFAAEYDFRMGDRTVSANYSVVPLLNFEHVQTGVVVVLDDITQEKRVKATLGRYMAPALAEQVLRDDKSRLGGVRQKVTVLFSDIRGYTTFAEAMDAAEVVELLNEYFSHMVDAVDAEHGVLDKFIGDAIMAVFGVPFPHEDDSKRACMAALRMTQQLRIFNQKRALTGASAIEIGVGINTGQVVSGNIGSEKRLDYTCIGDGINLGSRLESATKAYGVTTLLSEFTYNEIKNEFITRELDLIQVMGKQKSIRLYQLLGKDESDVPPQLLAALPGFAAALEAYRRRDWDVAMAGFQRVAGSADDPVSKLFLRRCALFKETPPRPDWIGAWEMTRK